MKQFIIENADIWQIFLTHYHPDEEIIFLHTSQVSKTERYSILAHLPYAKVVQYEGNVLVDGRLSEQTFSDAVDGLRSSLSLGEQLTDWPIEPELLGFVGYEQDLASFAAYDELLLFDHQTKILRVAQFGKTDTAYWMNENEPETAKITDLASFFAMPSSSSAVFLEQSRQEYIASVEKLRDYMLAGDIYVANLTQQLEIWSDASPIAVFKKVVEEIPAPFSSFLQYPDWKMTQISSSVERFVSIKNGNLSSKPIKGTIARGNNLETDELQKKKLSENQKERSELLMVTDLLRNDISRISQPFSLSVPKFAEIETFSHVHQLVTSISSKAKSDLNFSSFMTALFPGGSITGTPKKRAMEIIEEVEKSPRGAYTGMQGWLNRRMDLDMNIVIRTLVFNGENYQLGVGGGITYQSDAADEFDEILLKAQPFLNLFKIKEVPSPLFTTGLVENGQLLNLPAHVKRLEKQYHHSDLSNQLELFAQSMENGILRVSTDGDYLNTQSREIINSTGKYRVKLATNNQLASVLSRFKLSGPDFQKIYDKDVSLAKSEGYQDLLFHTDGLISELSIGNFVGKRGDIYETPARNALKGTYLELFSHTHELVYKDIYISDLKDYDALYMMNAVRGIVEIQII